MDAKTAAALDAIKHICDADPFRASVSGLREFRFSCLLILKVAETGKGKGFVPRRLAFVRDFVMTCDDLTGNVQTAYDAAYFAAAAVRRS